MTKEQEEALIQEQKKVWDWMFKAQEEMLRQRGYPCNDDGTRTPVLNLSSNKSDVKTIKY